MINDDRMNIFSRETVSITARWLNIIKRKNLKMHSVMHYHLHSLLYVINHYFKQTKNSKMSLSIQVCETFFLLQKKLP